MQLPLSPRAREAAPADGCLKGVDRGHDVAIQQRSGHQEYELHYMLFINFLAPKNF
jgi:hypothetical protein